MTDINRGLFVPLNGGVGTTSIQGRLALAGIFTENSNGVPRDGLLSPTTPTIVTGNGTTMSFDIPAINVVKNRTAGEGPYVFSSSGTTNTVTTAAPAGNPRIDLIWVKQNDVAKGDADNKAITGVTQGTPAATPVAPYGSVPAGAYVLAEATVPTTATKGSDASIVQVWRYTCSRGVPVPVRNVTERGELTARTGLQVQRLDLGPSYVEVWNGTAWVPPQLPRQHAEFTGTSDGTTTAGAAWQFNALSKDATLSTNDAFVTASASKSRLTFATAGVYMIHVKVTTTAAPGASYASVKNSADTYTHGDGNNGPGTDWGVTALAGGVYIPAGTDILFGLRTGNSLTAAQCSVRILVTKISD